ncbi:hypothetical protein EYZ11_006741 [Aspergillus tanneri]|uniref:Uncharacterized protein n=1 Tax=Aspergillus tanneri TaxID=1220188 RepID=A0A4V3UP56_9EURO|nr:hypothetical protein EYZ11_006741 [Aspergillus tanneri]
MSSQPAVLSHDESENERKPSISPETTQRIVKPKYPPFCGPNRPVPEHILDLLDEHHRQNGTQPPACALSDHRTVCKSKVFDRQGRELGFNQFSIVLPCQYSIIVLYQPNGAAKLAKGLFPYRMRHGSYLRGWLGIDKGFESECSAIRVFSHDLHAIKYNNEAWAALEIALSKQTKEAPAPATVSSTPQNKRPRESLRLTNRTNENGSTAVNTHSHADASADSDESELSIDGSEESSSDETSDEEQPEATQLAKKRRTTPRSPVAAAAKSPQVVFKLVSYKSGAIRCFPLDECKTGKDLFRKARDFFHLFDRSADVKILSCQIMSQQMQHYLFEGSEGEFSLLVDQDTHTLN